VEAVALFSDVADAWPCEVIGQHAGLVLRQHSQHLYPALGRHLRIGHLRIRLAASPAAGWMVGQVAYVAERFFAQVDDVAPLN
jgi:hypothetical protein